MTRKKKKKEGRENREANKLLNRRRWRGEERGEGGSGNNGCGWCCERNYNEYKETEVKVHCNREIAVCSRSRRRSCSRSLFSSEEEKRRRERKLPEMAASLFLSKEERKSL
uniref:Uncharacterized protein n=1 Tax=Nelumbo nucifera TaxID=4432 RepID=A0A822YGX5_NELNU|nr:TPA_asm: hypothetical protein HUJ06_010691 [Nelumbo nucifera]